MTPYELGGPARFAHQKRGLNMLIREHGVGALLFDPGLGKTATVLDYAGLLALKAPSREARVLVVCPLAAVDTWVLQAEKFVSPMVDWWAEALGGSILQRACALASRGGNPYQHPPCGMNHAPGSPRAAHHNASWAFAAHSARPRPVTPSEGPGWAYPPGMERKPRLILEVINLDTLASRMAHKSHTMADVMLEAVKRFDPDLLVVDESHKIKGVQANASRLLARMVPFVKRRIILTGTVMPHSPMDVFAQWRFLDPYAFGRRMPDGSRKQATYGEFKAQYAILGGWMGKQEVGYRNLDQMNEVMAERAVVARKKDALDLPPTTDITVPVDLSPAERKAYTEMRDQLNTQLQSGGLASVGNRLAQMMRLRQITAGHLPDDQGRIHLVGTSKVDIVKSLVNDSLIGENRVVVFALFTVEIGMLATHLATAGTEIMVIDGSVGATERKEMRRRFGDTKAYPGRIVMIAQIQTMSLAVNELVTSSHAVFASMTQLRDEYEQAKARLDRPGQFRPVTFWHAIAPGTVDAVILRSHRDRTSLEGAMLKHIQGIDEERETA